MSFLTRIGSALGLVKQTEGQYRDGPWPLPITGGWLPHDVGKYWNWWQLGYDPVDTGTSAIVEACVSAYAQTVAMCPGDHWRSTGDGGRERVTTSALSRLLRRPNDYDSISDFLLNTTRSLYLDGNAYALALRNDRNEIDQLHLMNPRDCAARLAETGDIFYTLGGNELIDRRIDGPLIVPARDVLHIRLHTSRHSLKGETPLRAAALALAAGNAMLQQQVAFYLNQARPSIVLTTDLVLTKEQVEQLREKWNEQSRGLSAGGTPILSAGLKPQTLSMTADDAQLADILKLSDQQIAQVFRVPLQILGLGGTPFASTEALMQFWRASGLGFCLNHIEEAIGRLYGLRGVPDEYVEFDTSALLRSATAERIAALAASVKGGIRTVNEARAEESLPAVEGGDTIRVQQQDVPLDWHDKQAEMQAEPPPAEPDADEDAEEDEDADERSSPDAIVHRLNDYADASLH